MWFLFSRGDSTFRGHDFRHPGPKLLTIGCRDERARWPYRFAVMAHLARAAPAGLALRSLWETLESGHPRNEACRTLVTLAACSPPFLALPNPAMGGASSGAYATLDVKRLRRVGHADNDISTQTVINCFTRSSINARAGSATLPDRPPAFPGAALGGGAGLAPLTTSRPTCWR
jgi:hypothetical protein